MQYCSVTLQDNGTENGLQLNCLNWVLMYANGVGQIDRRLLNVSLST